MTRAACTGATPPPKSAPAITSSPKLYNFLNSIPFLLSFIGEGGASPWPMGSDHLSGERCVLSVDCLLLCARDSPLLWVIIPECLIHFPYLSQFQWIVLNVSNPKVRKIKRRVIHRYICRVVWGVIFTKLRHCPHPLIRFWRAHELLSPTPHGGHTSIVVDSGRKHPMVGNRHGREHEILLTERVCNIGI
jgi:hypothetical protein